MQPKQFLKDAIFTAISYAARSEVFFLGQRGQTLTEFDAKVHFQFLYRKQYDT